ncbi:MAG TPA: YihY/virulence factor BrkB family protein [Longilinea sp.]|nr:YihY/virulence factor BrkB family protein [Longilinea sp.]
MAANKIAKELSRLRQLGIRSANRLDERAHGWLGILANTAMHTLKPDSSITAAAIAYFAIFSLFPFTLLIVAIASYSFGSLVDQALIIQRLEFIAPALGQLLGKNIDEIIRVRGPVTVVALLSLIWSASSIFTMLTAALNKIWGITRSRPVWKRRGLGLLLVLGLVALILFLASFANMLTWLPDQVLQQLDGIRFVLAIMLDIALFFVLYLMLPHAASGWRDILPGAVGAGLLWELAKKIFLLFISTYLSISNLIYGSVAAVVATLTWAYLSGLIFLFGAYLSVYYRQYRLQKKQSGS